MKKRSIRSVGIAGSIRGSGVTHLAVALANYAASGLGEKTACLELGGHGELAHWKPVNEKGYFMDSGIYYYPDVTREQIPILLNQEYERIIMDFGDSYLSFREELLRCDQKVFLLNLNPWQEFAAKKLVSTVQNKDWGGIHPLYAGVSVQKSVKQAIEKEFCIQIMALPFLPNPKSIPASEFASMDLVLDTAVIKKRRKSLIPFKKQE